MKAGLLARIERLEQRAAAQLRPALVVFCARDGESEADARARTLAGHVAQYGREAARTPYIFASEADCSL